MRKPFQGIINIIRFNWHFFVLSVIGFLLFAVLGNVLDGIVSTLCLVAAISIVLSTVISIAVSYFVYDVSNIYTLAWLGDDKLLPDSSIINVNAGLDEFSHLLKEKYPDSNFQVFDFYNPELHTEVSIKRARRLYPPLSETISITTSLLPLEDGSVDRFFVLLAAHEIRDDGERVVFFKELSRSLYSKGQIIVVEHLRDLPNFLAYNIGGFHFLSKKSWYKTFAGAELSIVKEQKITPFITIFTLAKNGTTS